MGGTLFEPKRPRTDRAPPSSAPRATICADVGPGRAPEGRVRAPRLMWRPRQVPDGACVANCRTAGRTDLSLIPWLPLVRLMEEAAASLTWRPSRSIAHHRRWIVAAAARRLYGSRLRRPASQARPRCSVRVGPQAVEGPGQ